MFDAEMSLLRGIAREADRPDSYDGPRNVNRLVGALQGLRSMSQGGFRGGGWFGYAPDSGMIFDPEGEDEPD